MNLPIIIDFWYRSFVLVMFLFCMRIFDYFLYHLPKISHCHTNYMFFVNWLTYSSRGIVFVSDLPHVIWWWFYFLVVVILRDSSPAQVIGSTDMDHLIIVVGFKFLPARIAVLTVHRTGHGTRAHMCTYAKSKAVYQQLMFSVFYSPSENSIFGIRRMADW